MAAVNGPSGTGKTTLLRDLIANVVVERAKRLATLRSARDAFADSSGWQAGNYRRTVWQWTEPFHGHEIVIASSNNGAVENVTEEIPGIDAVWNRYAESSCGSTAATPRRTRRSSPS